jgi:hypothetical protein
MSTKKYVWENVRWSKIYYTSIVALIVLSICVLFYFVKRYNQCHVNNANDTTVINNEKLIKEIQLVHDTITIIKTKSKNERQRYIKQNTRIIYVSDTTVDKEFSLVLSKVDSLARRGYFTSLNY